MYTKLEELRVGIMNLVSNHRHAIWSVSHAAILPAWITQSERKRYHRHAVSRFPMPNIFPSIRPVERADALLLIFQVFSIIAATIRPDKVSPAFHLIISPSPRVLSLISPAIPALSFYIVL
jgi:hypothetical protein